MTGRMASGEARGRGDDGLGPGLAVTKSLHLTRLLGRGGMGSVWVAHDDKLDRDVAVKFISGELAESEEVLKRFEREARIAAKVEHPHIVQVFDFGLLDEVTPYLVMELLKGEALDDRLDRDGRLPLGVAGMLVEQVAQALGLMHERGIIHRDIKPANIFLVDSGYEIFAKVVDFGIAKPTTQSIDQSAMTMTGMLIGTPNYMSPEQLFEAKPAKQQADIWALAVVAYEVLTGALPFEAETVAALGRALSKGAFVLPSEVADDLPSAFDDVFHQAFDLEPSRRFDSPAAFAAAFTDACEVGSAPAARSSRRGLGPSSSADTVAHASTVAKGQKDGAKTKPRPASPAPESFTGSSGRMGKYQLVAELGHGGMADVFLAVVHGDDFGVNKLLVVKRLRPNLAEDADFVDMIVDEARLAARLNHPNVVQTLEAGKADKHYFIAMEYLDGQPLHRVLSRAHKRQGGIPKDLAYVAIADLLAGLHYAHELADYDGEPLHVVHRDVSPHNVFVTYDGQVKVMDFGIAKAVGRATYTSTGVVKGKISYMAPEQARSDDLDRRVDIFAVGILVWEIAVGKRMWADLDELVVMNRVTRGDYPVSPKEQDASVPDAIDAICRRALAFDPSERYATAAQMQADIDDYLATLADADGPTSRGRSSNRDLGAYVAELFAEERRDLRTQIESRMKTLAASGSGAASAPPISLDLTTPKPESGAPADTAVVTSTGAADAQKRTGLLLAAGLALGVGGYMLFGPATPATAPTAPTASAAPASSQVSLRLRASPSSARFELDGAALDGNPHQGEAGRDDAEHRLVVRADGYQPVERVVVLSRGVDLEFQLSPVATSTTSAGAAEPPPQPKAAPKTGAEPAPQPAPKTEPESLFPSKPPDAPVRPIDEGDPWGK
jgi:eukaryotic-like serine/threonine-protein kinase